MKNGKTPTLYQKKIIKSYGLNPTDWLVIKNLPDRLIIVSRISLKKIGDKPKQKVIYKDIHRGE